MLEQVRLTGMVICRNEEARIRDCLTSLAFCDERVVIDSGSTDRTLEIVRQSGAEIHQRPFVSWNDQKEYGRRVSRGAWVLNLDADEVVTDELAREIRAIVASGGEDGIRGYFIPFRNHFRSLWVKRSGFYPDPHLRLVRRDFSYWDTSYVHDHLNVEGRLGYLFGHIDHYSFESISDFVSKSCVYASAFARKAYGEGRRASAFTIALHTLGRFVRAYFLQGGVLEGTLGLTISGLQAYEVFQKYVRLWELTRFSSEETVGMPREPH